MRIRFQPRRGNAATGKNPLFSCADCGIEALGEHHYDYFKDKPIPLVNAAGARLCVACFLGHNPEFIVEFRRQGVAADIIAKAQKLAAGSATADAPAKGDDSTAAAAAAEVK